MGKEINMFRSCLYRVIALIFIVIVLIAAFGYEIGTGKITEMLEGKSLIVAGIVAVLFLKLDPFEAIKTRNDFTEGLDSAENIIALAALVGAVKVNIAHYQWNLVLEWVIAFFSGLLLFAVAIGLAELLKGIVLVFRPESSR